LLELVDNFVERFQAGFGRRAATEGVPIAKNLGRMVFYRDKLAGYKG
jgi:hypothetical protein